MRLWRIHARSDAKPHLDAADFCVGEGIVGIGWRLNSRVTPPTKDEYRKEMPALYGSLNSSVGAFVDDLCPGDFVWTRNKKATYYLGKVNGDWKYGEENRDYEDHDIGNTRCCTWVAVPSMDDVPGAVRNALSRGRTVQRVWDDNALLYSQILFADLLKLPRPAGISLQAADILSLLSNEDLEDVVGCYLQLIEKCVLFPSTCKRSTPVVECMMSSLATGGRVAFQVKSGSEAINYDDYSAFGATVYLFALSNCYHGMKASNCVCLDANALRTFISSNAQLLPRTVQRWHSLVAGCP
jgi:hypothetical protein